MVGSNSHITILTLNVNGLNTPIKRHTGKLNKKSEPIGALYSGNDFTYKDTHRLKTKGWWKTYQSNGEQEQNKTNRSSNFRL